MAEGIRVRYFAAVREKIGRESERLAVEEGRGQIDVGAVWEMLVDRHEQLEGLRDHVRIARNGEFVADDAAVDVGDELAIIPPVSGGMGRERERYAIRETSLDRKAVRRLVARDRAGAVVSFEGTVRDETDGRRVRRLEYEAYRSMAKTKLAEIGRKVAGSFDDVRLAAHHRTGRLDVGETAVVVAASAPHRGPAFDAAREMIDRLKEDVPIWKKEIRADGSEWVGWGG